MPSQPPLAFGFYLHGLKIATALPFIMPTVSRRKRKVNKGREASQRFHSHLFGQNYRSRTTLAVKEAGKFSIFVFSLLE